MKVKGQDVWSVR